MLGLQLLRFVLSAVGTFGILVMLTNRFSSTLRADLPPNESGCPCQSKYATIIDQIAF